MSIVHHCGGDCPITDMVLADRAVSHEEAEYAADISTRDAERFADRVRINWRIWKHELSRDHPLAYNFLRHAGMSKPYRGTYEHS